MARGRIALLIVALLAPSLAACGFEPLYGTHARHGMEADLAAVKIMPIREHIGQLLQWQLEKDFNPDGVVVPQRYALRVAISIKQDFLAVQPDAVSTRGSVSAAADCALTDIDGKKVLYRSKIQSIADFNIDDDAFATEIAKSSAEKRVIEELGEQLEARLTIYFHNKAADR